MQHGFIDYNIVLCFIMLFCNVIMFFYLAMFIRNDATLFCNIIMCFHKLQYCFMSYYVILYYYNVVLCLLMLVCNDITLISML